MLSIDSTTQITKVSDLKLVTIQLLDCFSNNIASKTNSIKNKNELDIFQLYNKSSLLVYVYNVVTAYTYPLKPLYNLALHV